MNRKLFSNTKMSDKKNEKKLIAKEVLLRIKKMLDDYVRFPIYL